MIIYFNFNLSKVEFLQQQSMQYFAVDFLVEQSLKKDFVSIIKEVCSNDNELLVRLKSEKNYVVLPDEVVGFGNLSVPASRWQARKFFLTKFNLIYNKFKNLYEVDDLFNTNKSAYTYIFCTLKKQIISDIINTFSEFGVRVGGATYYSKLVVECLMQDKQVTKSSCVVALNGEKLIAVSNGLILGQRNLNYKNDFAKKFVQYTKRNIKRLTVNSYVAEDKVNKVRLPALTQEQNKQKMFFELDSFMKYYENMLGVQFNNNIIEINNLDRKVVLGRYKRNYFYDGKKNLF